MTEQVALWLLLELAEALSRAGERLLAWASIVLVVVVEAAGEA